MRFPPVVILEAGNLMDDFQRRALDIADTSSYLALYARSGQSILGIDYFGYNCEIDNLAAGASGQALVQIQSDSDFVLTYLSANGLVTATGATLGFLNATTQITDTGTGKTFFNQPALMGLVFGLSGYPFLLPAPRLIAPNTNIKFDITNLTATANTYYISMLGARIYYTTPTS